MLFQRSILCLAICAAFPLHASETEKAVDTSSETESAIEFNDQFLIDNGGGINVDRYAYGNPVLRYLPCKVNLNGNSKSTVEMAFIDNKTPRASACLTKLTLTQAGVDTSILGDDVKDDETSCVDIKNIIPVLLKILIVASRKWILISRKSTCLSFQQGMSILHYGIMVFRPDYFHTILIRHSESNGTNSDTAYAGLHYGLNVGPWRLRSRGSLNWDSDNGTHYSSRYIPPARHHTT